MKIQSKVAELTIRYSTNVKPSERPKIERSSDAEDILRPYFQEFIEYREAFYILILNRAHKVLAAHQISMGGISGTVVDIRMIFQAALMCNGSSVILAHNHPSGNKQLSDADRTLTKRLVEAGKVMDISVIDHLILTVDDYFSFADEGMI